MKKVLYDTGALLNAQEKAFKEFFYISNITLEELEEIKTSAKKDEAIKAKARKLINLLANNQDKFQLLQYSLTDNSRYTDNDLKIIKTAVDFMENGNLDLIFKTDDLSCLLRASAYGLKAETSLINNKEDNYKGFKTIQLNEEELSNFYENILKNNINIYNLRENEYLIIKDTTGTDLQNFKFCNGVYKEVYYPTLKSNMFGTTKPKDTYQLLAMDSLLHNKISVIRGPAGSGKSFLSFAALFQKLERGEIDRIIIFCNTVATMGSAKLGFYPGTRDEKLMDSQIGNFLSSKLGDKSEVERMLDRGNLVLLPMSDVRGYDTTGMRAGIYITEAQNFDIELMRLALQRIGEDSICILDGDDNAQVDLDMYAGSKNGLRRVSEIFRGSDVYGEVTLQKIHRSKIAELAQQM